jgi:hypothetical protein
MYLFISSLYMFRASQCSSSGDRIVLIHHLVWLVFVTDCLVRRSGGNCVSLLTGIPSSHLHRLIVPDDVLIQFDLLMMSAVMLETCRDEIHKHMKKCVKLVISKNLLFLNCGINPQLLMRFGDRIRNQLPWLSGLSFVKQTSLHSYVLHSLQTMPSQLCGVKK